MAEITREQVIDFLSNMPTFELAGFIRELEAKWGVTLPLTLPAPEMTAAPAYGVPGTWTEEQTEFTLTLVDAGSKRIDVIKAVREVLGLGLGEAKTFVESVPKVLKEDVSKADANELQKKFESVGAKVEIK